MSNGTFAGLTIRILARRQKIQIYNKNHARPRVYRDCSKIPNHGNRRLISISGPTAKPLNHAQSKKAHFLRGRGRTFCPKKQSRDQVSCKSIGQFKTRVGTELIQLLTCQEHALNSHPSKVGFKTVCLPGKYKARQNQGMPLSISKIQKMKF